jgi:hypothetical protein
VSPDANLNWFAVLYPVAAVPDPLPETPEPTDGVVLAIRFIPNCDVLVLDAVGDDSAVIVFAPDVNVVPDTVIEYPVDAFVDADIVEVPKLVAAVVTGVGDKLTVAAASVKLSASSTVALTVIWPAVEVATVPVSIAVVHVAVENVVIRRKNVEFKALGFVTLENVTVTGVEVGVATLPVLDKRSSVDVESVVAQPVVSPRPADEGCDAVAPVPLKPVGVVHDPLAVVQGTIETDFTIVAVVGTVKVIAYVVEALGAELPRTTLRAVICAAEA